MYTAEQENKLEGDPSVRIRKMLNMDMLRNEIYHRVGELVKAHRETFHCDPGWARISFDLNHRCMGPCFKEPCSIEGLVFREALETSDNIEVGNSVFEKKP